MSMLVNAGELREPAGGNRWLDVSDPGLLTSDLLRNRKSCICFVKERHVFTHVFTNTIRSHDILFLAPDLTYVSS